MESDPTKLQAVDSDAKNPQPFFKNNRPPEAGAQKLAKSRVTSAWVPEQTNLAGA